MERLKRFLVLCSRLPPISVTRCPLNRKIVGALICLIALFLPGILLVIVVAPYWQYMREQARARSVIAGINASVVGLLSAALMKVVITMPLHDPMGLGLVIVAFASLWSGKVPPLSVVLGSAAVIA